MRSRGTVSDARRAALAALIDHAPTFPPASLSTPDALAADRRARAGEHAWMLARLVWPASRLDELEGEDRTLSVLLDAPFGGDMRAEAVETRWEAGLDGLHGEAYVELPLGDGLEQKIAALAERGLRAKVRCGGAEVPSADALGRFLSACRAGGVPFKATAGLHHPVCGEYPLTYDDGAPRARMFGFLNIFVAAAFAQSRAQERELAEIVDDGEITSFHFGDDELAWRGRTVTVRQIVSARSSLGLAFGSCSFQEPVEELRAFGLL